MSIEITMPRLSDTMESGTILKWNVKEGDEVSAGDVVADIETDKATMEMSAYDDGTVAKIVVPEGETVDVGTVIAILAEEGEDASSIESSTSRDAGKKSEKTASSDDEDKQEADDRSTATATKEESRESRESSSGDDQEDGEGRDEDSPDQDEEKAAKSAPKESPENGLPEKARSESRAASAENGRVRVSPVARRLADEHGIDVRSIEGSGPSGRVIKRDVLHAIDAGAETKASVAPSARQAEASLAPRHASSHPASPIVPSKAEAVGPLESRTVKLSNMRQTIAKRLVESKTSIPHYQVTYTFNLDPLLELRRTLNGQLESQGVKLSVNDFLVRACALAMHRHHEFNASWGGDHIEIRGDVNIAIAISLPASRGGGLVVATIRNADEKGLRVISAESKELAEKARTKGLSPDDMSDSTFTLSNLGMFGVEHFTAIINPPNAAILAVGAAVQKPVVRDGQIVVGHEMQATLSCDHRIIDGAMAAEYLQSLRQLIENPGTLLV